MREIHRQYRDVTVNNSNVSTTSLEHRTTRRRRVLWSGLIFVPQTQTAFDCSIKEISKIGARVGIRGEAALPIKFLLVDITNRAAYEVECVRRNQREMGLKILRPVSLSEDVDPDARQLKRLMVERLPR